MKKVFRRFTALLLTLVLTVGMALPVFASGAAVIYNGSSRAFEFNVLPFGSNTAPDLFPDLKNLMPGDAVTQEITVGARKMNGDRVRIWLRAENPNEDYTALVETYQDWVTFRVFNGEEEITGNLADGVPLGTFGSNGKTTVTVTLEISLEADNRLQGMVAEIDWVFTAERIPEVLPSPDVDGDDLPWLTKDHINYIIGYSDGTVRPNDSITRAEAATIFYRLLTDDAREEFFCTESTYPDVEEDDWFYVAVCTLTKAGIFEGYRSGTFEPEDPITRAELATVLCRFDVKFRDREAFKPDKSFPDIKRHWAKEEIEFAATRGYVIGYADGTFKPDRDITRAETVTMINRCLKRAVDEKGLLEEYLNWPDNQPGAWYYYDIIEAANYHDYDRSNREIKDQSYRYENWTQLLDLIDWDKAEEEWTLIYTGR